MLQAAHRIWAPSDINVSMSTAVCAVMCVHATILAPFNGLSSSALWRNVMRPDISRKPELYTHMDSCMHD